MSETTGKEWLASLKSGDQVATHTSLVGYQLYTVAKRTSSGRIVLTNGDQYDKTGYQIGGSKWHRNSLEEVTPEILAEIRHQDLVSSVQLQLEKIGHNGWKNQADAYLEEVLSVLKKYIKADTEAVVIERSQED